MPAGMLKEYPEMAAAHASVRAEPQAAEEESAALAVPHLAFTRYFPTQLPLSASVVGGGLSVTTGTGSGVAPQNNVTVFESNQGETRWSYVTNDNVTAVGSHNASVIVALSYDQVTGKSTLLGFTPGSPQVEWIRPLGAAANPIPYNALAVADDGSLVAVSIKDASGAGAAAIAWYNATTGDFVGQWTGPANQTVYRLAVSGDGSSIAFLTQKTLYVVDANSRAVLLQESVAALSNAFCFSSDGQYLAYGYRTVTMYARTNGSYEQLWTLSKNGSFAGSCAASGPSTVVAWVRDDFRQNVVQWLQNPSSSPLWTYTASETDGTLQDGLFDAAITPDGTHAAFAGWGAAGSASPQILAFEQTFGPVPVYSEVTTGSMLTVDVGVSNSGVHIAAAGKHVHAGQPGVGGNIYEIIV